MPEPAVEELTFKNEDEKIARLEEIQGEIERGETTDLEMIRKVREAKVLEEQPEEPEDGFDEATSEDAEPEVETPLEEEKPDSDETPAANKPKAKETGDGEKDEFVSVGFEVPTETYHDGMREKRLFPFKTVKSALESIPHSQRHIQFLERKRIPAAYNEGYEKAKAEFGSNLQEVQGQLEELKKAPPAKPEAPAPETSEKISAYREGLEKLKTVNPEADDYDPVEHVRQLQSVLVGGFEAMGALQQQNQNLAERLEKLPAKSTEDTQRLVNEAIEKARIAQPVDKSVEAKTAWEQACRDMDSYMSEASLDTGGLGYMDMTADARDFHLRLAQLDSNKTEPTTQDVHKAVNKYLRGDREFVTTAQASGIVPPQSYQTWLYLDQVEALRHGWVRDPNTKEWREARDTYGNKLVFNDIPSSAARFDQLSGKKDADLTAARKEASVKTADAIGRRDKNVVSADMSKSMGADEATELTKNEASERMLELDEKYGMEFILNRVFSNDFKLFDELNECRRKLNMNPIALPRGIVRPKAE